MTVVPTIVRPAQYLMGLDLNLKKKVNFLKKKGKEGEANTVYIGYENSS